MSELAARVTPLLADAVAAYAGRPAQRRLLAVQAQLSQPLRVALVGRVKAGKSTLLNAVVGHRIAPTDAGECTRIVTSYSYGEHRHAQARLRSGAVTDVPLRDGPDGLQLDLGGWTVEDVTQLRVSLPAPWLREMTLIDTPGLASLSADAGERTRRLLLGPGGGAAEVDAVLYLMRHLHATDRGFLEVFQRSPLGGTTPVNALGVLSRADELGGGDPQALTYAARAAAAYRADGRLRALVHTVLPVAGLLAEAADALTDDDVRHLRAVNRGDPALLLTAARFTAPDARTTVPAGARTRLVRMLGMYGLRFALDTLRTPAPAPGSSTVRLRAALAARSGLPELHRLLRTQFAGRRDTLKADGVLRVLDEVTRTDPVPAAAQLRERVERFRVGAHELTEMLLLTQLRTGEVTARRERLDLLEQLLGGAGTDPATRLGLPPDAGAEEFAAALAAQRALWTRVIRSPLSDHALVQAAEAALRTCAGLTGAG